MKNDKKIKPKYSVRQNTKYVFRHIWENDKSVLFVMLGISTLVPTIPAVAMFLPMMVVALILAEAPLINLIITVLVFTAVTLLLQTLRSYLDATKMVRRVGLRLRNARAIVDKTIQTDFANLENKAFTDAKQKALNTTGSNNMSTEQVYYTIENIGANLLGFLIYIILLVRINPLLLLLTAGLAVLSHGMRRRANKWRHNHDDELAGYTKRLWYIGNVGTQSELTKDLRLFPMVRWINEVYQSCLTLAFRWQRRAKNREFLADIADCIGTFLREGVAYAYLISLILFQGLPVEQFVLLFAAIGGFSGWITGILDETATLQRHSLEFCRLREYLEYPETFKREDGESLVVEKGKAYTLELRNVSFRYPGVAEDILKDINLTIKAGEKLAIVGLNGAGKTTLVKLLCGFYDPTEGAILLNGVDIREYNREQYFKLFTAVFQEFNILPITIAENIAQDFSEGVDKDRVNHCLRLADIQEIVEALPSGMDSLLLKQVHEEAVELSGGETQRLMLARALYKDSPVLILDEPTAALDPIAESRLYQQYNELSAGKTSIFISHRLASTRFCDRIILLAGKVIAESGTHEELLAAGGDYANLFEIQSKYYREGGELNGFSY